MVMQKIFSQILRESLKRKDGVYILSGSGLNADYHNIEVWKDGEKVEKTDRQYAVTPEHEDSIFNKAKELADKGMSVNEAAKTVAAETGFKKSDIYKIISE